MTEVLGAERMFALDGRVAVVTGASSGLGERFARVLAAAGAEVIAAARRTDRLESLAAAVDGIESFGCDVTDAEDRRRLVAHAERRTGSIDILVNNAGMTSYDPAESEDVATFARVVDLNLTAVFALSQLVGRLMIASGRGSIVNIASVFGLVGAAPLTQASYGASKGGVIALTRQLAGEWARKGVRVNAIAPGFFESEMTAPAFENDRSQAWIRRKTPMGRAGEPGELDGLLLLLASDAGAYVTGQTVAVDGGWTAV
jgi:NAD(P)-dependent dehydrogenase (short-subunit alcohol dehydrogenase family)